MEKSTHVPGRRCNKCGVAKPFTEFTRVGNHKNRKTNGYRGTCRDCNNAYLSERSRERREFLKQFRLERGCMDCGYNEHYVALDFDHRPGEVKLFEPSDLKAVGTWQQMLDEIAKCDVVCSNCHRVRGAGRPPANLRWDLKSETGRPSISDPDQLDLFDIA